MAEPKNKKKFTDGPWMFGKGVVAKSFVQVSPHNLGVAIVKGRILYVIELIGREYMFKGTMEVTPWFEKGWHKLQFKPYQKEYPGFYRVYFPEDQNFESTKTLNRLLIDKHIANKELYIKPSDPILQYLKETK